jgi:hypothetical protein
MERPKMSELAGCRRLCDDTPRYARAFEWRGLCVKLYRPIPYEGGGYSDPGRTVQDILEGVRRLQEANVPVLPVMDCWQEENCWLLVQPLAEEVPGDAWFDLWEVGRDLVMRAYVAGVADVLPCNIMWTGEDLVVVDTGEVFDDDEDGYYWICLDESWYPLERAA